MRVSRGASLTTTTCHRFRTRTYARLLLWTIAACATLPVGARAADDPQPGPEAAGLRLRFVVEPRAKDTEGFKVRVDVMNASAEEVTLTANWRNDEPGDVAAFLEAETSIECVPAFAPWIGGVQQGHRKLPQPTHTLKPGETLTAAWETASRQLKNLVTNPNEVQNPKLRRAGLYSVHATVELIANGKSVQLRSNEQLVSVGGSRAMPKHTYGQLLSVDADKSAVIGLGSLHGIEAGDVFEIGSPKGMHWRLTIGGVNSRYAFGKLELLTTSQYPPFREPPPPYTPATLVETK
jgi:hypothetical protein